MVPAPGTPVGGERPSRQLAAASGGAMDVDSGVAAAVDDIPMAAAPAPGQGRLYCPVPGCPCADPARAPGWQSESTLRAHVDAHLSGSLLGQVPSDWLQARGRQRCGVCGLSVATRFGIHPTCRPAARAAAPPAARRPAGPDDGALPSVSELQSSRTPTLRHVPLSARSVGPLLHPRSRRSCGVQ